MNYEIKRPEGFRVNEVVGDYGPGECCHFTLWKKNYTTIKAIEVIARALRVNVNRFSYAGLKDKHAITTQRVSAWRVPPGYLSKLALKGIRLSDFKTGLERIRIGSHLGNEFIITLTGVKLSDLREPARVPNYFGPQRFGGNEVLGEKLIKSDWRGVTELLLKNDGSYENKVRNYLKHRPSDYLGALKQVNPKYRKLWVNAYQAHIWNKELDMSKEFQEINSVPSIKEMPELGIFPGTRRRTLMEVTSYQAREVKDGVELRFTLPRGSYATVLIDHVTNNR